MDNKYSDIDDLMVIFIILVVIRDVVFVLWASLCFEFCISMRKDLLSSLSFHYSYFGLLIFLFIYLFFLIFSTFYHNTSSVYKILEYCELISITVNNRCQQAIEMFYRVIDYNWIKYKWKKGKRVKITISKRSSWRKRNLLVLKKDLKRRKML